jgi:very-short-patch-repair endonuclease
MATTTVQSIWALVRRQHGVVARWQLLDAGLSSEAVRHRIREGRLHPLFRGVYAVGRPQVTPYGRWMAAVLACGEEAHLSHRSAAALWGLPTRRTEEIHVSMPVHRRGRRRPGIVVHRRTLLGPDDRATHREIPVTAPIATLIDLATSLSRDEREAAVNEADKLGLVDSETLRAALDEVRARPGVAALRRTLDAPTFTLTDSALERAFLKLARQSGLPRPETQAIVNGYRVDFFWPELGLVVETDGLTYHRTPAQQARDRERDQAHTAAGLTALRFTHAQVSREASRVRSTLQAVARRRQ